MPKMTCDVVCFTVVKVSSIMFYDSSKRQVHRDVPIPRLSKIQPFHSLCELSCLEKRIERQYKILDFLKCKIIKSKLFLFWLLRAQGTQCPTVPRPCTMSKANSSDSANSSFSPWDLSSGQDFSGCKAYLKKAII